MDHVIYIQTSIANLLFRLIELSNNDAGARITSRNARYINFRDINEPAQVVSSASGGPVLVTYVSIGSW